MAEETLLIDMLADPELGLPPDDALELEEETTVRLAIVGERAHGKRTWAA